MLVKNIHLKEGLGDFGRGLATGVTGVDFTDQKQEEEQPTYKTNIDPMTGQENIT